MNASSPSRLRRPVAAFLLVIAFLALPTGAAPRDWSFFSSPWSLLSALWAEIGLVVDPGGQPNDYGSVVDPSGQPAANPGSQDYGSVVDPDGQSNH